jgi:ArsR family transcriptional regulator, arsenate/arsenite/antimonite-responsive transcriptional repressor
MRDNPRREAELLRLLGHPTRLAIMRELVGGAKCVTDIRDLLEVPQANVSQHLSGLRREQIIDYHEHGKLRCYYITRPKLVKALLKLLDGDYPVVHRSPQSVRREGGRRNVQHGSICHTR